MNHLSKEKTMTVKEVAEILGVTDEAIKKHIRELFPNLMRERETTYLNEYHVTEIKKKMRLTTKVASSITSLDIEEMTVKVLEYHINKAAELKAENEQLKQKQIEDAPKVESFLALQRSDQNMSITECSKYFGLHPRKQVFQWLRKHGYLTNNDLPTMLAITQKVLAIRENRIPDGNMFRPQAVIESASLELWRVKIAPKIQEEYHECV